MSKNWILVKIFDFRYVYINIFTDEISWYQWERKEIISDMDLKFNLWPMNYDAKPNPLLSRPLPWPNLTLTQIRNILTATDPKKVYMVAVPIFNMLIFAIGSYYYAGLVSNTHHHFAHFTNSQNGTQHNLWNTKRTLNYYSLRSLLFSNINTSCSILEELFSYLKKQIPLKKFITWSQCYILYAANCYHQHQYGWVYRIMVLDKVLSFIKIMSWVGGTFTVYLAT